MRKQYHILNGDSLKKQFPGNIQGTIIVIRECLVEGNVKGKDLDELFVSRAKFLRQNYEATEQEYFEKTVSEFKKIESIIDNSDINLWFEDDLFCQVNFWFVVHLLSKTICNNTLYLVRPETHTHYGFGALDSSGLTSIFKNRSALKEIKRIANLWVSYQKDDLKELNLIAESLEPVYPFIMPVVKAHLERELTTEKEGRPTKSLKAIMKEIDTEDFGIVFREFSKRESIYGFGDLQVRRLFDNILSSH